MAEADSYIAKSQKLASSKVQENHPSPNPSKFFTHFLLKALIVSIFVVVLPLFPSQAPEFINHALHTRSWELLQLVFVGIAVSYGLFSKRNDETDKEYSSKFDNAQSYVSRLLQVSSVFDDEPETPSETYENKVQTWNSQYYRGEPMLVVAPENSVLEEQRGTSSRIGEKPLLLPIRSLKSRVHDPDVTESSNESVLNGGSLSRSNSISGSKRFVRNSSKSRTGELGNTTPMELGENVEENVVLRSPIPWKSRSGRMEMKEDLESLPLYSLPPSGEESELNKLELRSFSSQSSRSSRPNSTSPSPKKLSPSPSLASEFQSKNVEDMVRKKSFRKSSPPPAPPPPPLPPFHRKPPLMKSNLGVEKDEFSPKKEFDEFFPQKEFKRSIRSAPEELNGRDREDVLNRANTGAGVRPRTSSDTSLIGRSVRTLRQTDPLQGASKAREFTEEFVYRNEEKRSNDVEEILFEKRKYAENIARENVPYVPKAENNDFLEQVLVETDEDSETEDDDFEEILGNNQEFAHNNASDHGGPDVDKEVNENNTLNDGGPDVDKKADEFIAKFREQIRLQRIASIRRSTGQLPRNPVR